jgi:predicted nucleic acid-binding protein
MSDRVFLDTNIIIYLYSETEPLKRKKAIKCIDTDEVWISTQVINESINVFRRKFTLNTNQIKEILSELLAEFYVAIISDKTIYSALDISNHYGYSYFDSLMLASGLEMQCKIIYSEDLQHGQYINNLLTIINPFILG